jgi:hypothetical protein
MTDDEATFSAELETFRQAAEEASQFLYAYLAIHRLAKARRRVLKEMQRNSLFWLTVTASLQTSLIVTLGRIFDQKSKHNLDRVVGLGQRRQSVFSRAALATRKRGGGNAAPWLQAYIRDAYVPDAADFRAMRKRVAGLRRVYEKSYRALRQRVFAHRETTDVAEVAQLFALTNVEELKRLVASLLAFHEALWGLFWDGRRPAIRRLRYSARPARDLDAWSQVTTARPHERIVLQAEDVLKRASGLTRGIWTPPSS